MDKIKKTEDSVFSWCSKNRNLGSNYAAKIHQIFNNATKKRKKFLLW